MIMKNTTYQNLWNVVKTNHKEKPTDVNAYIRNKRSQISVIGFHLKK